MSLKKNIPNHVAIIMDGNGRWAAERAQERSFGHNNGVDAVREVVKGALVNGVQYLTIYAFSTENWKREQNEIDLLMNLISNSIINEIDMLKKQGVKMMFIGDTQKLPTTLKQSIDEAKTVPIQKIKLNLIVALNYSSRWEITQAVRDIAEQINQKKIDPINITEKTITDSLQTKDIPDPDLIIRTSGEQRLSNFLLWQSSYSELYFTQTLWPDFDAAEFQKAIDEYSKRNRRYGTI